MGHGSRYLLVKVTHPLKSYPTAKAIVLGFILQITVRYNVKKEQFLFCEALSGKPTRRDEISKVSTAARILIHYHPNLSWSKLKCPFLDYDSREHDQLMQLVMPPFFFLLKRKTNTVSEPRHHEICDSANLFGEASSELQTSL